MKPRILVGCEYSGIVRDAFAARGWDAWSCDLLPSEKPGNHFQCDIFDAVTNRGLWDLIILHPPCTAMGLCGNRHYGRGKPKHVERARALLWTERLVNRARQYARSVAVEQKKTWFWLYGLPCLVPTNDVYDEMMKLPKKDRERIFFMSPSSHRGHDRSLTYSGVAKAMADQWTKHIYPNGIS